MTDFTVGVEVTPRPYRSRRTTGPRLGALWLPPALPGIFRLPAELRARPYARVYDDAETRSATATLDVHAKAAGRVAMYRLAAVRGTDQAWMTIALATAVQTEAGIKAVLSTLNIRSWANHTRF